MTRFDAGRGLRSALAWTAAGCGAAQVHPACGRPVPQASGSESGGPGPRRGIAWNCKIPSRTGFLTCTFSEPIQDRHRGPISGRPCHHQLQASRCSTTGQWITLIHGIARRFRSWTRRWTSRFIFASAAVFAPAGRRSPRRDGCGAISTPIPGPCQQRSGWRAGKSVLLTARQISEQVLKG